jgi:hypothetical protein
MTRIFSLALAAALFIAAPVLAQTHADAMARLAPFEGTYALNGEPQMVDGSFDGSLTISPTLGGHFQQWDWEMDMKGDGVEDKVHLRFIATYDRAAREYVIYRFDSRDVDSQTRASNAHDSSKGTISFDGDALVMAWPTHKPNDPAATGSFRNTVRLVPQGLHVDTDVKMDGGGDLVAIATTRANRR